MKLTIASQQVITCIPGHLWDVPNIQYVFITSNKVKKYSKTLSYYGILKFPFNMVLMFQSSTGTTAALGEKTLLALWYCFNWLNFEFTAFWFLLKFLFRLRKKYFSAWRTVSKVSFAFLQLNRLTLVWMTSLHATYHRRVLSQFWGNSVLFKF